MKPSSSLFDSKGHLVSLNKTQSQYLSKEAHEHAEKKQMFPLKLVKCHLFVAIAILQIEMGAELKTNTYADKIDFMA